MCVNTGRGQASGDGEALGQQPGSHLLQEASLDYRGKWRQSAIHPVSWPHDTLCLFPYNMPEEAEIISCFP